MNPLILHFRTPPADQPNIDESMLQYNSKLKLSVVRGTGLPAFDYLALRTMTGTKANNEVTDSDYANSMNLSTSDDDHKLFKDLSTLMATQTITLSLESIDEDHGTKMNKLLLGTMTMTRTNMESSDSDS